MRQRRWITTTLLAAGLMVAGCASQKTKPDEETSAKKSETEAANEKKSKDEAKKSDKPPLSEVLPESPSLELRSKAPPAEKLGEVDGVYAYSVGDLTVIHKPTPANRVASAKLYIDGGVAELSDRTAGIEKLALRT
ncbi:MAG: hypothetical protein ABEN55_06075, partial [Bradymonadaceae bacterium]